MRAPRVLFFLLICLTAVPPLAAGNSNAWLPVSDREKQINDVPGNPGAPAIRLYYSSFKDDNEKAFTVYERIKILNAAAMQPGKYADVRIVLRPGVTLKEFAARTIHPDGSIVEFSGKPLEKVLLKARRKMMRLSL